MAIELVLRLFADHPQDRTISLLGFSVSQLGEDAGSTQK
jgi:hypothetical protein